jgi:hypothetical protein
MVSFLDSLSFNTSTADSTLLPLQTESLPIVIADEFVQSTSTSTGTSNDCDDDGNDLVELINGDRLKGSTQYAKT